MNSKSSLGRKSPVSIMRCTAIILAVVLCTTFSTGCTSCGTGFSLLYSLVHNIVSDDIQVVFDHEDIDTSPYSETTQESSDSSLWQSLMDTPTSSDGIDYTSAYYDNRLEGDYVIRALYGESLLGYAGIVRYVGTDEEITLPETLGDMKIIMVINGAFEDNSTLRSVTIPECYTDIGASAFKNCTSLQTVSLPKSATAIGQSTFWGCTSLESIVLPDSIDHIDGWAFNGCTALKSVTLPKKINSIGCQAFGNCTSLESIIIPDSVTTMETQVFIGCTSLKRAVIGNGLTELPGSMFSGCTSLNDVSFKGTITTIGQGTFKQCGFTKFEIPDGVVKTDYNAFYGCEKLKELYIPSSLTSFANSALLNTPALENIKVSSRNSAFYSDNGVLFGKDGTLIRYPAARSGGYRIPQGVTNIADNAFALCKGLTSIDIPDSVISISKSAFEGTSITTVSIPASVISIGQDAFYSCPKLTSVSIGNGSAEICDGALCNCPALNTIKISGSSRYTVSDGMIIDTEQNTLVAVFGQARVLNVPEGVIALKTSCAYGSNIAELTLPSTVQIIGNSAFAQCTSLRKINFGGREQTIETAAFKGCIALESIELPDSVTSVGQLAFSDCTALSNVTFGNGLTVIDYNILQNCTSLRELVIPNSVVKINSPCDGCTALERLILSDKLVEMSHYAFGECPGLRELYYPSSLDFRTSDFSYDSLERIYYSGTKREWQLGFNILSGYNYELDAIEIIYNSERPTE